MTNSIGATGLLANHAVCAAAGVRDGLRITQFFVRDLAGAERWGRPAGEQESAEATREFTYLSVLLSRVSRLADRLMTWSTNTAIALFVPDWRKLPSPFNHGMMTQVAEAIGSASFVANPLFNAYFYRAAIHILRRYRAPPFLVLEHRVDAARRMLASVAPADPDETDVAFLARALNALVATAPVARAGKINTTSTPLLDSVEPNVAVYATACVALLFAEEGRPAGEIDEDQFFAVVGALIASRLPAISAAVMKGDEAELMNELIDIKAMY
jgi:hypothetical protein